jgi:hypothetical protein
MLSGAVDFARIECGGRSCGRVFPAMASSTRLIRSVNACAVSGRFPVTIMYRPNRRRSHTCRVASPIEVTVEAPPGEVPGAIRADPATLTLNAALRVGKKLQVTWVWYGPWRGARDAIGRVSLEGLQATTPMSNYTPACYHSDQSSRLSGPGLVIFRR